jgi:hypothetical protein
MNLPLVFVGADSKKGFGRSIQSHAKALRNYGWSNITVELVENSGHYLTEHQPEAVAELIARYASR